MITQFHSCSRASEVYNIQYDRPSHFDSVECLAFTRYYGMKRRSVGINRCVSIHSGVAIVFFLLFFYFLTARGLGPNEKNHMFPHLARSSINAAKSISSYLNKVVFRWTERLISNRTYSGRFAT